MLNKIICRLIKKQEVTFGDIIHHMEFYVTIYAELIMIISLTPVFITIFNPQYFEFVVLGTPFMIIFLVIPGFIIFSFKYILDTFGLYDNIIKFKIAECSENYELMEKDITGNFKEKIVEIFGCIIILLMILLFAEMIYFDVPFEPI